MNDMMKDATAVLLAIVSVAVLYVLVSRGNQTAHVVGAGMSGLSNFLGVAMGGTPVTNGVAVAG